jgi:hypothetical protein
MIVYFKPEGGNYKVNEKSHYGKYVMKGYYCSARTTTTSYYRRWFDTGCEVLVQGSRQRASTFKNYLSEVV